jgi:RimJ/RimL family protein N-acetyltransferase
MSIDRQLFEGQQVRLAAIDYEKDPDVESRWTHDLALMRALDFKPARPLSPAQMKKKYEAIEKEVEESKNSFYFTIRSREDDRLLGFIRLYWIEWSHGNGNLKIAIGDPEERGKGYGWEALQMLFHFAFDELNLYRLSVVLGEDNPGALRFFQRAGFVEEVRRRQAIHRDGRFWDVLHLGLLADEWRQQPAEQIG